MKNYYLFIFLIITLLLSSLLKADADNDQWLDTEKTYSSLIDEGYEVKAYDITNFYDNLPNITPDFIRPSFISLAVFTAFLPSP